MKRSRKKKYQQFFSLTKPSKDSTLLDVGVTDQEYSPYDNYLEKKYPYPHQITALSIHPLKEFRERYPKIKTSTYKGREFPFKDKQFDIAVSNAVIEHVGGFKEQLIFLKEMGRVGHQFFFATPAKEFPIEMHTNYPFIHWFKKGTFDKIVSFLGKRWASGSYIHLLNRRSIEKLLKASNIKEYKILTHRFGPFPLHYAVWGK
jgi:SAM-dependent methyltransferase